MPLPLSMAVLFDFLKRLCDPCVSQERWGWWTDEYRSELDADKLFKDPDYYPFELADVVRFVEDLGDPRG